ncbi:iron-sulfur cluster biosynthesis family protein [Weissella muntiaci]|uniref:Iron-sulfur cluster biosynthesis family protein n=1 Tax=Weissella muntiaci TaxID=2508881 RepID=A0A6C2C866_9LACO|nr:iron-sulfur cluster biosynthesis family protein [Weissella muntiaci]TYC49623.1 iron-sulfur cluster biosynthesis family protein [Weissella muntiaci]
MFINFTNEALDKINPILKKSNNRRVILMYEDGVSPYSVTAEGAMQNSLVIVVVRDDQPLLPWFDVEIDSNIGKIPVKGHEIDYLAENMIVEPGKFGSLIISSEQGVIDDTVIIRDGTSMTD